ncbi:MAG: type IV toxin-antitoxin system AbiEi family antitoxin domain-containing protein [Rikenellaceae bacterium]
MGLAPKSKLNRLLLEVEQGKLVFSSWLKKRGYSDQLLKQYRLSGWLTSLAGGVMCRAGAKLTAIAAISSYDEQMEKSLRIAAHSALELFGFRYYQVNGCKPTMVICHHYNEILPQWLIETDFDYELKFFRTRIFPQEHTYTYHVGSIDILTSTPEQAFLECLILAPQYYKLTDLYQIMKQLSTLKAEILQPLLESVQSNKVKRLFLYMAQKVHHTWYEQIDPSKIEIGTGKYQIANHGIYIPEYKMTIPKELYNTE